VACATCQLHSSQGAKFCLDCGASLGTTCARCHARIATDAKFCAECGAPASRHEGPTAEGERRHLTVLFCDLANSTLVAAGLDAEDWSEALVLFQAEVSRVITDAGGYVAQHLGDGLLAYFGYPLASEHSAARASRCALSLVAALQRLNPQLKSIVGVELSLRVGLHSGTVVVSTVGAGDRKETLAIGNTANVAARVQASAAPNTVLISDATHELVARTFITEDRGEHQLKGIEKPMRLHAVVRERRRSREFVGTRDTLTPFVDRSVESGAIVRACTEAEQGRGSAIIVRGEAGGGKSRLIHEVHSRLSGNQTWLELRADPDHRESPLYAVLEMQRELLDVGPEVPNDRKLERLEQALARAEFELVPTLPLLAALHDIPLPAAYSAPALSPLGLRKQTLALLIDWLLRLAREQSVVLAVEDLHWLDPSTLELLGLLATRVGESRLLMLMTTRPEFAGSFPGPTARIELGRLGVEDTARLIQATEVGASLPEAFVRAISARSGGIPYFAEELASFAGSAGGTREEDPAKSLPLPATLAESLAARVDQAGSAKEVVQLAAVLGLEFPLALLEKIWHGTSAELEAALRRAEQQGLLSSVAQTGSSLYFFRHALFRDAAYDSLLRRSRRRHHLAIAEALKSSFPEKTRDQPEVVAHHLTLGEDLPEAIHYWQRAGHHALERGALEEALAHLRTAQTLLAKSPDRELELDVVHTLARTLVLGRGWAHDETKAAWERAAELCNPEDTLRRGVIACGLGDVYSSLDLPHSLAEFERLVELGRRSDQSLLVIAGQQGAALALYYMGRFLEARAYLDAALALYDPKRHRFFEAGFHEEKGVNLLCWSAWIHGLLGRPERGLAEVRRAIEVARSANNPFAIAFATSWAASHELYTRHWADAIRLGKATVELSLEQGFVATEALGRLAILAAGGMTGEVPDAAQAFLAEVAKFGNTGNRLGGPNLLALLADVHLAQGNYEGALAITEMGLGLAQATGQPCFSSWLLALRADALEGRAAHTGEPAAEIEPLLRQALELAGAQQARPFEVRAAMSLFRLLERRGNPGEGRDVLAAAISRFPEQESDFLAPARALLS
jgi:class 3 adenylate cyclase/tetratricopeptide (TPR) repeat protein